jgi:hypothetical protein
MTPNIRTGIAYVAGCLILKKTFSALRDESQGSLIAMTGSFSNGNIDVQNRESGATIMGMAMDNLASFSQSPENISVTMQLAGGEFKGADTATKRSFNGSVTGMTVKVYDYDEGKYFYYALVV